MTKSKRVFNKLLEYVPPISLCFYAVGAVCAVLYAAFLKSSAFADFFNDNISSIFRRIFAYISAPFPFSIAEAALFCSPVLAFFILRALFRYMDAYEHGFARSIVLLTSVLVLLLSVFVLNFGAGYRTSTLDERLGLETGEVTQDELYDTAVYVVEQLNDLADEVTFTDDGSVRGCTHADTVELAYSSYESLGESLSFLDNFKAPVKRLAISPLMTYTHISGVYTFFTGEANLNCNYPEFVNVYTIAHEMAHQRGIARENEANFVAYLVCIGSENAYMRYSGYLNMFEYLVAAMPSSENVKKLYSSLDSRVYFDLVQYSKFFDKYRDSTASEVSGAVNDTYLQSQGTEGTKSYGMVVDLAVAYHKSDISAIDE